ncbi:MAG: hypothetical protein LBU84_02245 [Prevotella sp.]|jgi:hypothetical protein|nr:hypothetical protein [Prevotella sp.]
MAKRSDGIRKVDDINEKEFLSILSGRSTPGESSKKKEPETVNPKPQEVTEDIEEEKSESEIPIEEKVELEEEEAHAIQKPIKQSSKRKMGELSLNNRKDVHFVDELDIFGYYIKEKFPLPQENDKSFIFIADEKEDIDNDYNEDALGLSL